jgi:exo-beta-1,3-glucanase (GH17 family)
MRGSKATDEYKEGLYYQLLREWTNNAGISCFYFEAFDEQWKDAKTLRIRKSFWIVYGRTSKIYVVESC